MGNLATHGEGEQHDEIDEENGPKDGHVEEWEECAEERDDDGLHGRIPVAWQKTEMATQGKNKN